MPVLLLIWALEYPLPPLIPSGLALQLYSLERWGLVNSKSSLLSNYQKQAFYLFMALPALP